MSEVARIDDGSLDAKKALRGIYSSIKGDDFATRLEILKAVNDAEPISQHLGEVFELRHMVVQPVDSVDDQTGEASSYERVILIGDDGRAFVGASTGLMNSVRTFVGVMGEPDTWGQAIPVTVTEEGKKPRSYFRINLA